MTPALNSRIVRAEAMDMTASHAVTAAAPAPVLRIPRVLHRIWLGDAPMPEAYAAYGESWAREHPEWESKLWTDANRPALRNEALFAAAGTLAQKADILRYEVLLAEGGVYVDCDFECRRNIEPLLDGLDAFVVPECDTWIAIGIFGAVPGHPFLEALVGGVPGGIAGAPGRPPNEQTGPFLMTRIHGEWERAGRPAPAKLAPALFYPYGPAERHRARESFPEAYGIHHWGSSWVAGEDRPEPVAPVRRVVIAPDWGALAPAAAVTRVACTLFGPADHFELAFLVADEPGEADGDAISALLAESAPDPSRVPDAVVYGFGEAIELSHDVAVVGAGDTVRAGLAAADAIAAMTAIRAAFDGDGSLPEPRPGSALGELGAGALAQVAMERPRP